MLWTKMYNVKLPSDLRETILNILSERGRFNDNKEKYVWEGLCGWVYGSKKINSKLRKKLINLKYMFKWLHRHGCTLRILAQFFNDLKRPDEEMDNCLKNHPFLNPNSQYVIDYDKCDLYRKYRNILGDKIIEYLDNEPIDLFMTLYNDEETVNISPVTFHRFRI